MKKLKYINNSYQSFHNLIDLSLINKYKYIQAEFVQFNNVQNVISMLLSLNFICKNHELLKCFLVFQSFPLMNLFEK